jgi:hypothetical protein
MRYVKRATLSFWQREGESLNFKAMLSLCLPSYPANTAKGVLTQERMLAATANSKQLRRHRKHQTANSYAATANS